MGYKLKIASVGKTKETWLDDALNEYEKRLSKLLTIEWLFFKNDAQLLEFADKESHLICLDPEGKQFKDSVEFGRYFLNVLEQQGSRLTLVIGGPEGIPNTLLERYPSIRLSNLTYTHQIVRLVLVEQIYRAFEIARGSPYHK